jgi:hypothetical protein
VKAWLSSIDSNLSTGIPAKFIAVRVLKSGRITYHVLEISAIIPGLGEGE